MTPRHDPRVDVLADMLTYCRPAGSAAEDRFRRRFLYTLPDLREDDAGNLHLWIDRPDGTPSAVVWSAHTDTVHRVDGRQRVQVSRRRNTIRLPAGSSSNCLGADDTVGVWILRELAIARVPGHYVWHYGEERGGIGSSWVVREHPEYFAENRIAIALDRRGTTDVITHQAAGRCCSDAFAVSLARAIGLDYGPCDRGIYTDTAEYTDLLGECTNLSVGYHGEHTSAEYLDVAHALTLCDALCRFDESALVVERRPGDPDPDEYFFDRWDDGRWKYAAEDETATIDPVTGEWSGGRPLWDYGGFDRDDLTEDDRQTLQDMGLATKRRSWAFY